MFLTSNEIYYIGLFARINVPSPRSRCNWHCSGNRNLMTSKAECNKTVHFKCLSTERLITVTRLVLQNNKIAFYNLIVHCWWMLNTRLGWWDRTKSWCEAPRYTMLFVAFSNSNLYLRQVVALQAITVFHHDKGVAWEKASLETAQDERRSFLLCFVSVMQCSALTCIRAGSWEWAVAGVIKCLTFPGFPVQCLQRGCREMFSCEIAEPYLCK